MVSGRKAAAALTDAARETSNSACAHRLSVCRRRCIHHVGSGHSERSRTDGRPSPEGDGPVIDGRVDEASWSSVEPFSGFVQQEPDEGQPATERTEVRFILNRETLYIGIVNFDSEPDRIVVSRSRRAAELTETDSRRIGLSNTGQPIDIVAGGRLQPELSAEAVAVDPPHPAALQLPRIYGSRQQVRQLLDTRALRRHRSPFRREVRVSRRHAADRPTEPFTVYQDVTGRAVVIPAGEYAWTQGVFEGHTDLSAPISAFRSSSLSARTMTATTLDGG